MKDSRFVTFVRTVTLTGVAMLGAAVVHAAAAQGGQEGWWWFCHLLGIPYNR